MSPFDPPDTVEARYGVPWREVAEASPKLLRNKYWYKYNTIQIPLLDHHDFFCQTIAAAQHAHDSKMLEDRLAELHQKRVREFEEAFVKVRDSVPSEGSLTDMLLAWKVSRCASLSNLFEVVANRFWPEEDQVELDREARRKDEESGTTVDIGGEEEDPFGPGQTQPNAWWAECDYKYDDDEEEWIDLGLYEGPKVVGCEDVYEPQPEPRKPSQPNKPTNTNKRLKRRQRKRSAAVESQNCDVPHERDSSPKQPASHSSTSPSATHQNHPKASPDLNERGTCTEMKPKTALDSPPQPKHAVPVPPTPEASDPELQSASQSSKDESIREGCSLNIEGSGGNGETEKAAAHEANPSPPSNKRQRADTVDSKSKRRRTG